MPFLAFQCRHLFIQGSMWWSFPVGTARDCTFSQMTIPGAVPAIESAIHHVGCHFHPWSNLEAEHWDASFQATAGSVLHSLSDCCHHVAGIDLSQIKKENCKSIRTRVFHFCLLYSLLLFQNCFRLNIAKKVVL